MNKIRLTNLPVVALLAACGGAACFNGQAAAQDVAGAAGANMEYLGPVLPDQPEAPRSRTENAKPEAVAAPANAESRDWFGGKPWTQWEKGFGDIGGVRTELAKAGLTFNMSYTMDWQGVWSGGVNNRASTRHLLDINLDWDLSKIGLDGGRAFAAYNWADGRAMAENLGGDEHLISGIEARSLSQLAQLWYQQSFFDDRLRIKLGKIDVNAEFGFVNAASEFLTGDSGLSPTFFFFPTYPDAAMGAVAFVYPTDNLYAGFGFFDGSLSAGIRTGGYGPASLWRGDEYFYVGEAGLTWETLGALGGGRLAAGAFYHTGSFATFAGGSDNGTGGFYAILEQQLIATNTDDASRGLFAYIRGGTADEDVSLTAWSVGGGLSLRGTFPGRDSDSVSGLFSVAGTSNVAGSPADRDEMVFEVNYRAQLTPWFSIRPTLQYLMNPGGRSAIDDAVVGGARFEVRF